MDTRLEASELESLLESAKLLSGTLDLDPLLRHLLRTVMGRFLVTRAAISIRRGRTLTTAQVRGVPALKPGAPFDPNMASSYGVPLLFAIGEPSEPLGFLALATPARGSLDAKERDFLQALLGLASSSIQNATAHEQLVRSHRTLDQKIQELRALLDLVRGLSATVDPDQVAQLLMLTLSGRWGLRKHALITWKPGQPPISRARGIEISDQSALRDLGDPWVRGEAVGLPEFVIFPIRSGDTTSGAVICGPRLGGAAYSENDLEFGAGLVAQASVALDNGWHFRDTLYRQQLEKELSVAASIQKDLFPQQLPQLAHTGLAGRNRQAREVGGDYYDVLPAGDAGSPEEYLLCVADISGKGVSASLLMANIQATLRALLSTRPPLTELVARVNDLLYASTPSNKYATGFFLQYNPDTGQAEYVNGGHNEAIVLRGDGTVELLGATGMPIGLLPKQQFGSSQVSIHPGDLVLLFSDGVPEAWNEAEEDFGNDRIISCLRRTANEPPERILDEMFQDIDAFVGGAPQHDDITLLVLKRSALP